MESSIVRNGCGGTRAAYGTATILRTTAALMETIGKIQEGELTESILLDVSSNGVKVSEIKFQWRYVVAVDVRMKKIGV